MGEIDVFDSDDTEPIGERSDEELPLPPAQMTAPQPHYPTMFTCPHGMVSPSPVPSEDARARLEWEREKARSRLTQFDDELFSLHRADHLLAIEPESLVASRSPYWVNYNAIIGARGELFQYVWHEHSEEVESGNGS